MVNWYSFPTLGIDTYFFVMQRLSSDFFALEARDTCASITGQLVKTEIHGPGNSFIVCFSWGYEFDRSKKKVHI